MENTQDLHDRDEEELVKTYLFGAQEKLASGTSLMKQDYMVGPEGHYTVATDHGDIIDPPYEPSLYTELIDKNARLNKCIHTYAQNTVGIGYGFVPVKKVMTDGITDAELQAIDAEKARVSDLFEYPNPKDHFNAMMSKIKVDEETTGNGYMEVARDINGKIVRLFHLPSFSMRVRKGGVGYVQIDGAKKIFYKEFGDQRKIDKDTGEEKQAILHAQVANEVIHFAIYHPKSKYYGVPRYISATPAIVGNRLAAIRNVNFFKNDATPRLIITCSNGQLTSKSFASIEKFVDSHGKGIEKAHRVMVLQAEGKQLSMGSSVQAKIDVTPLTVGVTDDASFQKYRIMNDEEIRECFGIAKLFLGTADDVNKRSAFVSRNITNEQEFMPDIRNKEYIINQTIMKDFEVKLIRFIFEKPKAMDALEEAKVNQIYANLGESSPNELRQTRGKSPWPYPWANKPISIVLKELATGRSVTDPTANVNTANAVTATDLIGKLFKLRSVVKQAGARHAQ